LDLLRDELGKRSVSRKNLYPTIQDALYRPHFVVLFLSMVRYARKKKSRNSR